MCEVYPKVWAETVKSRVAEEGGGFGCFSGLLEAMEIQYSHCAFGREERAVNQGVIYNPLPAGNFPV